MSNKVTNAAWTFCFLVLFTGPPKFRVRDADASLSGELDTATVVEIIVWAIGALFLVYQLFWSKHRKRLHFTRLHWIGLTVIGIMCLSGIVSISPLLTLFKAFQVLVAFLLSAAMIDRFGLEHFFRLVLIGSLVLCLLVTILYFIDASLVMELDSSGELRLRGRPIYEVCHPALFAIIISLGLPSRITAFRIFILSFCGVLLLASLTRIDWLALAIILALVVWLQPDIPGRRLVNVGFLASPVIVVWALHFMFRSRELASWYDLSERGGLWAYIILTTLTTSPIWGNGFIAGSRLLGMDYMTTLASGHSLFIDMFAGCGLVGLIAFAILCTSLAWRAAVALLRGRDPMSFLTGGLFWALILIGCFGGDIEATPFGFLFWGLVAAMAFRSPLVDNGRLQINWLAPRKVIFVSGIGLVVVISWMVYMSIY